MTNKVLNSDIAKQYDTRKSISDHLPWVEWSDAENIVLLEDFKSCGALLEIQDISTEAKPQEMIEEIHKNVKGVFQSVVPLEDKDPWIVQIYIQDDLTLDPLNRRLEEYVKDPDDPLTKKYLSIMARHFKLLGREQGMFRDPLSDLNFRGRTRRIRLAVYRRYEDENNKASKSKKKLDVVNELRVVTETLMTQLRQGGMNVRRLKGQHFYEWLVRWFNPKPAITDGDQDELLKAYPYPGATKPHGWNFTQNVFFDTVKDEEGAWVFDGIKHKVMVFQDLQDQLDIGVISRERSFGSGKNHYALIDKFPPGTIYTMQLIFESKTAVEKHLNTIKKAAVGQELVIQEVKRNVERAFYEVANGNMLFRSSEALYIRAATHEELEENERNIRALLVSSGLTTVKTEEELYPQDVYLRFLPFNFSYAFDKKNSFRSTYKYADDIARLLPVYGRSKGDGMNPLVIGYNRGGEPFIYDHSSNDFKQSNSHMFICGTTGSGKSVSLNSLILAMSAVSNPRIIAIEVGGSFDLTTKFLSAHGRNVRTLKFSRKDPIVLNPYSEAYKALEMVEREEALLAKLAIKDPADLLEAKAKQIEEEIKALAEPLVIEADDDTREDRDILTEMMLATRIMVTGGDDRENEKISRSDMMLIMQTLIHSMKKCRDAGAPQMLVQHVAAGFNEIAENTTNTIEQARLREFGRNLTSYTLGMKAQFVNGESEPLGEFDCLHVDFGFMQEESNRDLLNICCISLLSKVMAIAEAHKASFRPTFLVFDEIHIFLSSEIGIVYLVLLAKVARKFGVWLIFATQNINDFSGRARKILSMIETWICLSLDREEVAHIETFKPLSDEMKALLLSVQKFPGIYSEGVLIGKRYSGLFRNVPPRFMLALSMTEQNERAELAAIMRDENLSSELEAVEIMALRLEAKQAKEMKNDRTFLD